MTDQRVALVRVLFASPGDTAAERAVAERVLQEINRIWGQRTGIWLRSLKWEDDTHSATGTDGQAVINEMLGDYEALIGIMRNRFGSPTPRYASGTQEEYERAHRKREANPDSLDIAFFFSSAPVSRDELDAEGLEQLQRVRAFQDEVGRRGTLYREYSGPDEFEVLVRLQLSRLMQKWQDRLAADPRMPGESSTEDTAAMHQAAAELPPLSDGALVEDLEAARAYLQRATAIRDGIRAALTRYTEQTVGAAQQLTDAIAANDIAALTQVQRDMRASQARALAEFGDVVGPLVIPLTQAYRGALLPASRLAAYVAATRADSGGALSMAAAIDDLRIRSEGISDQLRGFRDSLASSDTGDLRVLRNRQHALYAVDAILSESKALSSLMTEVATALRMAAR